MERLRAGIGRIDYIIGVVYRLGSIRFRASIPRVGLRVPYPT